jgi:hypothetical protein
MSKCKCTDCKCGSYDKNDFVAWAESKGVVLTASQLMIYNHVMNEARCLQYKCRRLGGFTHLYTLLSYWLAVEQNKSVFMILPNHSNIKSCKRILANLGLHTPHPLLQFATYETIETDACSYGRINYVFCDEAGVDRNLEKTFSAIRQLVIGATDNTVAIYSSVGNPYLAYLRRVCDMWHSEWTFFQVPSFVFNSEQADVMRHLKTSMSREHYAQEMGCKLDG